QLVAALDAGVLQTGQRVSGAAERGHGAEQRRLPDLDEVPGAVPGDAAAAEPRCHGAAPAVVWCPLTASVITPASSPAPRRPSHVAMEEILRGLRQPLDVCAYRNGFECRSSVFRHL